MKRSFSCAGGLRKYTRHNKDNHNICIHTISKDSIFSVSGIVLSAFHISTLLLFNKPLRKVLFLSLLESSDNELYITPPTKANMYMALCITSALHQYHFFLTLTPKCILTVSTLQSVTSKVTQLVSGRARI